MTPDEGKAAFLEAILNHTTWPQEDTLDQFIIGQYGRDRPLLRVLQKELPKLRVRGKPVVVVYYRSLIEAKDAQILVLAKSQNLNLNRIVKRLHGSHTMIVSDGSEDQRNVMINFTHPADNILSFEVNRSNIIYAGLKLSKEILLFGGTELDTALIYKETEEELARARNLALQQQQDLENQQKLLAEQNQKIIAQSKQFSIKEAELKSLEDELNSLEEKFNNTQMILAQSEKKLLDNVATLREKESILAEKEAAIEAYSQKINQNISLLERHQQEINEQERLIQEKNLILQKQVSTIENQKVILGSAAVALLVVLTSIAFIFRSYRSKNRINKQLQIKSSELEKANEQLVIMTDAKSQFLSTMSHEIRTPLNGVIGVAELLKGTKLGDQQAEYVSIILKSADTLLSLINDILDISKIEAGKLDLEETPFNLSDILGDTLQALAMRANDKHLELAFHIPPEVPNNVIGDPVRLRQVVVNLVGNAIKFTQDGEIVVDLKLESIDSRKIRVAFEVRDTGIGISDEQIQKIFKAFGQADSSTTRQFGGTGLGLTIASQLVTMMGGELNVSSEPGKGSTFSFSADFNLSGEPAKPAVSPIELRGTQVLVVDDNSTNRMILEEMMSSWGMVVTTAQSGPDAIDTLNRSKQRGIKYALAVLDVMMPGMDGFELAEKISKEPFHTTMQILILSSAEFFDDDRLLQKLHICKTLLKPVKHSELLVAITNALGVATAEDAKTSEDQPSAEIPIRNVLLVEDGFVNQKVATDLLVKRGHKVTLAENGEEALAAVQNNVFDLILMDVQMPVMDGLTATRKIRELETSSGRHIPIVAMTASATTEDRNRCMNAGMDSYVSKPFRAAELYQTVETTPAATAAASKAGTTTDKEAEATKYDVPESPKSAPELSDAASDQSLPSPTSAKHSGPPCLDIKSALKNLEGDRELLHELIEMFLQQYPELLQTIETSLQHQQATELRRAAHTLKSSANVVGAETAAAAAAKLEQLAHDNQLNAAEPVIKILKSSLDEAKAALQQILDVKSPSASDG
ncbi:DUF4154 domain-containing protein [Aestuariicella hydrocarbonica]|uniref:histidine kinase n=1 Tax=Pseudomaricurvus hydrocarbonicus TaxID=1470433 RepID=A0A9E5JTA9_9GAMM|nr:DUF4154 domain-containing protein [Aestuariicella hydrocarbonica]